MFRSIWKIPKTYRKQERDVSLLELFFDVIVVALIGASVYNFSKVLQGIAIGTSDFSDEAMTLVYVSLQTLTVLFMWRSFTIYSSRYEEKSIRHRTLTFFLMLALSFMVVADYLEPSYTDWAPMQSILVLNGVGVLLSTFMLAYMNLSVSWKVDCPYEKKSLRINAIGRFVHMGLSLISFSLFWSSSNQIFIWSSMYVWSFSLIVWIIFDYFVMSNRTYANTHQILRMHIQERYSIIFIVFMGEMFIRTISGVVDQLQNNPNQLVSIVIRLTFSFITLFAWWWIFKELYNYPDLVSHPIRIFTYTYAMLGILSSMIFSSVGFSLIFHDKKSAEYGKWIFWIGMYLWHLFQSIVLQSLRPYKVVDSFIFPAWFTKLLKNSFFIWWIYGWVVFVPMIGGDEWIYIACAISVIYVIIIESVKINIYLNRIQNKVKFNKYIVEKSKKDEKWIAINIAKHIDVQWHYDNNFAINKFSGLAKKLYYMTNKKS